MNEAEARGLFMKALEDRLEPAALAEFEALLASSSGLCAEFEYFADRRMGAGATEMQGWLRNAGQAAQQQQPAVARNVFSRLIGGAQAASPRGRLIPLFASVAAVAAAAILAILIWPSSTLHVAPTTDGPGGWPEAGADVMVALDNSAEFYPKGLPAIEPEAGVELRVSESTLVRHPTSSGLSLVDGSVTIKVDEGAEFEVRVGEFTVTLAGPAEALIYADPTTDSEIDRFRRKDDHLFRARALSRFGATRYRLKVDVRSGTAHVQGAGERRIVGTGAPALFDGGGGRTQKPRVDDVFGHLDRNGDGALGSSELALARLDEMDENRDGEISALEFRRNWQRPTPEPAAPVGPPVRPDPSPLQTKFDRMDRDGNGVLDANEAGDRLMRRYDHDGNGEITREEFDTTRSAPPERTSIFGQLDKNGDGKLDSEEVDPLVMTELDANYDGYLSREEFEAHPPRKPERARDPKAKFAELDKNSDGVLTRDEIDARIWAKLKDIDGSGDIDLEEFLAAHGVKSHRPEHRPRTAFERLDRDGNGRLEGDELRDGALEKLDRDGNGYVDADEFRNRSDRPEKRPRPGPIRQLRDAETAFAYLDSNSDGKLDADEFDPRMLKYMDANKDGTLSLEEFKKRFEEWRKKIAKRRQGARGTDREAPEVPNEDPPKVGKRGGKPSRSNGEPRREDGRKHEGRRGGEKLPKGAAKGKPPGGNTGGRSRPRR